MLKGCIQGRSLGSSWYGLRVTTDVFYKPVEGTKVFVAGGSWLEERTAVRRT